MIKRLAIIIVITLFAAPLFAQHGNVGPEHTGGVIDNVTHHTAPEHSDAAAAHAPLAYNHPTLSQFDTRWAGVILIVVAGMFLAAVAVGPIIRSEMPEEVPDAHSHDEPPGSSGHHGATGTHTPTPDHHH